MPEEHPTTPRNCDRCGAEYEALFLEFKINEHRVFRTILGLYCEPCAQLLNEQEDRKEAARRGNRTNANPRLEKFMQMCPFTGDRESHIDKFPVPAAAVRKVADWIPKSKSLIVSGISGLGKSRAAWMAIKRLYLDDKKSVIAMDCQELGNKIAECFRSDVHGAIEAFVKELKGCDVLYIDDLGKGIFTERYKSTLYDVVKFRSEFGRPMLITTNYAVVPDRKTGVSELSQRIAMSSETQSKFLDQTADAIVRRLLDYSDGIRFERK